MSKHECICKIFDRNLLIKHENSDFLSLYKVPETDFTVILKTDDWINYIGKAIYIEPDTLVNVTLPQFSFLTNDCKYDKDSCLGESYARIKAKRLRGIVSYGLLVPVEETAVVGDNYWDKLDLHRYEPQPANNSWGFITSGEAASGPNLVLPKYDVESFLKYGRGIFIKGELVWITAKYHGSNSRFCYHNDQFYCGSRTEWKKEFASPPKADLAILTKKLGEEKAQEVFASIEAKSQNWQAKQNLWWRVLRENEPLQKFLTNNPNTAVYGETIGVQGNDFLYGLKPGKVALRVFDIMQGGKWLDAQHARDLGKDLPWVTLVHKDIPFNFSDIVALAENPPIYDNKITEGFVIKPAKERYDEHIGRVQAKIVTPKYLERS